MAKRNRGTMALSEEGKQIVKTAVIQRGWSQDVWAREGFTSVSTAKRLLNGIAVEARCFHSLLQALGLEVQDSYIHKKSEYLRSTLLLPPLESTLSHQHPGVFMTATFLEDKRSQIQRALCHLRELMLNGEVTYLENGEVIVSGEFSEDNREHIRMTITQLEGLFSSCKKTWVSPKSSVSVSTNQRVQLHVSDVG